MCVTVELMQKFLHFLVYEFEVLFYLIDFELVVAVAYGGVVHFIVLCFAVLCGVVEEVVPVEFLVVGGEVVVEGERFGLGDAQFGAEPFDGLGCGYFLSCEEVPDEGDLVDDDFDIGVADVAVVLVVEVVEAELQFLLWGAVVDFIEEVNELFAGALVLAGVRRRRW
jgi:hypothetical protein